MVSEFVANHSLEIFPVAILLLVLLAVLPSWKKSRKYKPDPPSLFAPIRGMYVCYQCDTIFNTTQCPGCGEEALIPLVHLTGSLKESDKIAALVGKLQNRAIWKVLPAFQELEFHNGHDTTEPSTPEFINGDAAQIQAAKQVHRSEGGRGLS